MKEKQKVVILKNDGRELERLINDGWQVTHAFPHPQGGVFILKKNV